LYSATQSSETGYSFVAKIFHNVFPGTGPKKVRLFETKLELNSTYVGVTRCKARVLHNW